MIIKTRLKWQCGRAVAWLREKLRGPAIPIGNTKQLLSLSLRPVDLALSASFPPMRSIGIQSVERVAFGLLDSRDAGGMERRRANRNIRPL